MAGAFFVRLPGLDEGFDFNEQAFGAKKQIHRSLMLYDHPCPEQSGKTVPSALRIGPGRSGWGLFLVEPQKRPSFLHTRGDSGLWGGGI